MPSTTEENGLSIRAGAAPQATAGSVTIYMDQWCVQVRCKLRSGVGNLTVGTAYTLVRDSGSSLANMYCDELPAALAPNHFSTSQGWVRFSNRKLADGRDNLHNPAVWTIGTTPLGQAPVRQRGTLDPSKLSFSLDD